MNKFYKTLITGAILLNVSTSVYGVENFVFVYPEDLRDEIGGNPGHIIYKGRRIAEQVHLGTKEVKGTLCHRYSVNDKTASGESISVVWGDPKNPNLVTTAQILFAANEKESVKIGIAKDRKIFFTKM